MLFNLVIYENHPMQIGLGYLKDFGTNGTFHYALEQLMENMYKFVLLLVLDRGFLIIRNIFQWF